MKMQSPDARARAGSVRMSPAEDAYEVARSRLLKMFSQATKVVHELDAGRVARGQMPMLDDFARALDDVTTAGTLLWLDIAARELRDVWDEDATRRMLVASATTEINDDDEETMS